MSERGPFSRDEGREVFGAVADAYAAARPDYPERVYDVLRVRCALGPRVRVLEIGAGSGQATRRLLELGATVVAVEPDARMAEHLGRLDAGRDRLEVVVRPFETTSFPVTSFDLVASATAFHWLDPSHALPAVARVLRPGGSLALWWNLFGDPDAPDPFHDATQPLLRDLAPSPLAGRGRRSPALDVEARRAELSAAGFEGVEHEVIPWTLVLTAAQTRLLYSTYSNIARLPEGDRRRVLEGLERVARDAFADRVERRMLTPLYTARRAATSSGRRISAAPDRAGRSG